MSSSFSTFLYIIITIFLVSTSCFGKYFPVSTETRQCCINPVESFILRLWSGPCACQTLNQKWLRYKDWIELNDGWIHPWIEFRYVNQYRDQSSINDNSKSLFTESNDNFNMHSHERGLFANIRRKYRRKVRSKDLLFQIPFKISFSQFIISKYIQNSTLMHNKKLSEYMFPRPDIFMPDGFPDWNTFREEILITHRIDSIRGWLALGLAWIRENTYELLPWIELLPPPDYLPITWDKFLRDEFLLTNTYALRVINQLERELSTADPYIKLLGLTKQKVREAFAWISSRSFGMNFQNTGGYRKSPVIPCGIDFVNHNIYAESSLYYDNTFGRNKYSKNNKNNNMINSIINTKSSYYGNNGSNSNSNTKPNNIDYVSNYLWINNDVSNNTQFYVNYGKHHTSSSRFALFGFIDDTHPNDHVNLQIDLNQNDRNRWIKYKYFQKQWNTTWIRLNKTKEIQNTIGCYIFENNQTTWNELGLKPKYSQNYQTNENKIKKERIYSPPLTLEYYGQNNIRIQGNFLKFLRLNFLSNKYFDSFTISSILNDFEYNYLQTVIDPIVRENLNNICLNQLNTYPTSFYNDKLQLRTIERQRKGILYELELNSNRNLKETERLSDILVSLDRDSLVLQYRIREKGFLDKCSKLHILPTQKYLNKHHELFSFTNTTLSSNFGADSVSNSIQDLIRNIFNFSSIVNLDISARRAYNDTDYNHTITVVDGHNNFYNQSINTNETFVSYIEILNNVENVINETGINISTFNQQVFDDDLWSQIVSDAITETLINVYDTELNNNNEYNTINDGDNADDDEQLDESDTTDIIDSGTLYVNKKDIMIGTPKIPKETFAETIGWNSPRAGLGSGGSASSSQSQTITISSASLGGGQGIDLSSLFGGNGAFQISGNIQINNGQIIIGGANNNNNNNNNNNLNNLLSQFMNINTESEDELDDEESSNAVSTETKPEIPETVPFSQLMSSATVSVFGLDENGRIVNVGNALNTNNLASLFGGSGGIGQQRKPRNRPPSTP